MKLRNGYLGLIPSLLLSLGATFLGSGGTLYAQDLANQLELGEHVSQEIEDAVLAAIIARPKALKQGHVQISSEGEFWPTGLRYDVFFDFPNQRIRTDRIQIGDKPSRWQSVRRPEWQLIFFGGSGLVSRHKPDFEATWQETWQIDVRAIGFLNVGSIPGFDFDSLAFDPALVEVRKKSDNEYLLVSRSKVNQGEMVIETIVLSSCDVSLDYAITKSQFVTGVDGELVDGPEFKFETKYERINKVVVPRECQFSFQVNQNVAKVKWDLEWINLNEDVAERVFTIAGMGLRPGTLIVDRMGDEPVIKGKVGEVE